MYVVCMRKNHTVSIPYHQPINIVSYIYPQQISTILHEGIFTVAKNLYEIRSSRYAIEKQSLDSNRFKLTIYMGVSVYLKNHGRSNLKANRSKKHPLCNIKRHIPPSHFMCIYNIHACGAFVNYYTEGTALQPRGRSVTVISYVEFVKRS